MAAAKDDIDSFQSLTNHPILDFNLDYEKGLFASSTSCFAQTFGSMVERSRALSICMKEIPRIACTDVRAILVIAKGETDERVLISQLVRIAIAAIGANATWEILQDPNISDNDLAQLQQDWQSLEFVSPLEHALKFERVSELQEFAGTRISTEKFNKLWGYFYALDAPVKNDLDQMGPIRRSLFLRKCDEHRWRWFWSYQDELYGLQSLQVVLECNSHGSKPIKSLQAVQSFSDHKLHST